MTDDIQRHRAEQARARALGLDYAEIRHILLSVHSDNLDEQLSEGAAVERIREIALRAVDKAVAEDHAAVVAWLRAECGSPGHEERFCAYCNVRRNIAADIERGEHRREEEK
jgi:hypothetical protein